MKTYLYLSTALMGLGLSSMAWAQMPDREDLRRRPSLQEVQEQGRALEKSLDEVLRERAEYLRRQDRMPRQERSTEVLPVREVVLSSVGLAQITRQGQLNAKDSAMFVVPIKDVDDILKSLLIQDAEGSIIGVRLPGPNMAEEAFQGLPLKPEDFGNRVRLLTALKGQRVEIAGLSGRLSEVSEVPMGLRVTLITDTGLTTALMTEDMSLRLLDRDLAEKVSRAAGEIAQAGNSQRSIEVMLDAHTRREVALTYLMAAPVWKPSWRLMMDASSKARLQGWAVVENTSGANWDNVRLQLISGHPMTLAQPLYTPLNVQRRVVSVQVPEGVNVQADVGMQRAGRSLEDAGSAIRNAVEGPPAAMAPAAMASIGSRSGQMGAGVMIGGRPPVSAAQELPMVQAGAGRVSYTLPSVISIRGGETANLPFLDEVVDVQRVWWVQSLGARNPLQAARVRNTTSATLPAGVLTAYEDTSFLGDAQLLAFLPGEERLIGFAVDQDMAMNHSMVETSKITKVSLEAGSLNIRSLHQITDRFVLDGPKAGRLVVNMPSRSAYTPKYAFTEAADKSVRYEQELVPGINRWELISERESGQDMPLWQTSMPELLRFNWRTLPIDRVGNTLPGNVDQLQMLEQLYARTTPETEGRAQLQNLIEVWKRAESTLVAFRQARTEVALKEAAVDRGRQAIRDRTGPEREEAVRALNTLSLEVENAGKSAEGAFLQWKSAVQELMALR